MDSKVIEKLKETLGDALAQFSRKPDINPHDVENMTKILCALDMLNGIEDGGYSERSYRRMRSHDGSSNDGSYRRYRDGGPNDGGSHRYHDGDGGSSNERGYSGHDLRGMMLDKLDEMMDNAHTEKERKMVQEWMGYIDRR